MRYELFLRRRDAALENQELASIEQQAQQADLDLVLQAFRGDGNEPRGVELRGHASTSTPWSW